MKTALLLVFCWSLAKGPVLKVHVFERSVHPGIRAALVKGNNGSPVKPTIIDPALDIYLEVKNGATIGELSLCINGKQYQLHQTSVVTGPIVSRHPTEVGFGYTSDTLVPPSRNQLHSLRTSGEGIQAAHPAMSGQAELHYTYRGRTFIYPIATIKKLSPVILE